MPTEKETCYRLPFAKMTEWQLYKNVNTFDDQWYMRVGDELLTCSAMSNQTFNPSSASRKGYFFTPFKTKLTRRV